MSDDIISESDELLSDGTVEAAAEQSITQLSDDRVRHQLRGMYRSWFLDYAS